MYEKFIKAFKYLTKEGFNYATNEIKRYYPWLKEKKNEAAVAVDKIKKEAAPVASKTSEDVTKFVVEKYNEAKKLSKKAKKDRKKQKMNSIRNTIIATTIGFGAGAATGYVLVKKSQIKDSDYVFSDDEVIENTDFDKIETPSQSNTTSNSFSEFSEKYEISEDGTTWIKK